MNIVLAIFFLFIGFSLLGFGLGKCTTDDVLFGAGLLFVFCCISALSFFFLWFGVVVFFALCGLIVGIKTND